MWYVKGKNEREVLQDDKTHGSLVNYIKKLRDDWFTDEKKEEIIKKWKKKLLENLEKKYYTAGGMFSRGKKPKFKWNSNPKPKDGKPSRPRYEMKKFTKG